MIGILAQFGPAEITALGVGIGIGAVVGAKGITHLRAAFRNGNGKAPDPPAHPPIDADEVQAFAASAVQSDRLERLQRQQEKHGEKLDDHGEKIAAVGERLDGVADTQKTNTATLGKMAACVASIDGYLERRDQERREDLP
ncbi:MAG: hypothetical protein ACYTKD_23565 [Planctomycetota bacterium]|jgi:hypothetical protein